MGKWRKWAKLGKPPETVRPLLGYAFVPATIDIYGRKVQVMQYTKINQPLQKGSE